jgi:hypothetical protein
MLPIVSPDFTMYFSPGRGTRPGAGVLPSDGVATELGGVTGAPGTGIVGNGVVADPAGGTVTFDEAVVAAPFAVVGVVVLLFGDVPMPHDANRTAAKTLEAAIVVERATEFGMTTAYDAASAELCHFDSGHNPCHQTRRVSSVPNMTDCLSEASPSRRRGSKSVRDE